MTNIYEGADPIPVDKILRPLPSAQKKKSFARRFGPERAVLVLAAASVASSVMASGGTGGVLASSVGSNTETAIVVTADAPATELDRIERVPDRSEEKRRALVRLILKLGEGKADPEFRVDPGVAATAARFIEHLPRDRALPRFAADAGAVMFVWDEPTTTFLVTAEASILHAVISPLSPKAKHLDSLPFDGEVIPPAVLENIPRE